MPNPDDALARLQAYLKPGVRMQGSIEDGWSPPEFESYEAIRVWLNESVLTAQIYEALPEGRWTIQLLLKEQVPGTYRYIVL
jgi:hypothetical protein